MPNKYIRNNGNGNFKINTPFKINTYSTWSVETKIATGNIISDCTLITTEETDGSNKINFKLDIVSQHLKLMLSYNGTEFEVVSQSISILDTNNVYYIMLEFSGTEYNVKVSVADTATYVNYINIASSLKLYSASTYIKFVPTVNNTYFNGNIDINATKLVGDSVIIFYGNNANSSGYYNIGTAINSGVASNFSINNYIQCNGFELNAYIKVIMRITTDTDIAAKQVLLTNKDLEIYIKNSNLYFNTSTNSSITLTANTTYYIGYICTKNIGTQVYTHQLYYILDNGYYNDYSELPDFNVPSIIPWNIVVTDSSTIPFKNTIYIGSDTSAYYFKNTIDLNNTIISNNIGTYNIVKPGPSITTDTSIRCYAPKYGTRILDSVDTVISDVTLDQMYKVTITAKDQVTLTDIDLSTAVISYTVTNSTYGNSNYYKRTNNPNVIYVLPGSNVTYTISNVDRYAVKSGTIANAINSDTSELVYLKCNMPIFKIKVYNISGTLITTGLTVTMTVDSQSITTDTIMVSSGKTIEWSVSKEDYITQTGTITNIQNDQTLNVTLQGNNTLVSILGNTVATVATSIDTDKTFITKCRSRSSHNKYYILNGNLYNPNLINNDGDWQYVNGDLFIKNGALYRSGLAPYDPVYTDVAILLDNTYTYSKASDTCSVFITRRGGRNYYIATFYGITSDNKLYRIQIVSESQGSTVSKTVTFVANNVTLVTGTPGYVEDSQHSRVYYYAYYISDGKLYYESMDPVNNIVSGQLGTDTDFIGISGSKRDSNASGYKFVAITSSKLYSLDGTSLTLLENASWTKVFGNTNYGYVLGIKNGLLYSILSDNSIHQLSTLTEWTDIGGGFGNAQSDYGYAIRDYKLYSVATNSSETSKGTVTLIDDTRKYLSVGGCSLPSSNLYAYAIAQII